MEYQEPVMLTRFQRISQRLGLVIAGLGGIVLIGWIFDIPIFQSIFPNLATMKFNTALLFVLTGISLAIRPTRILVARILATIVVVVALLTIAEYLFGWNLGIDELFWTDAATVAQNGIYPGRMSIITALDFALLAGSLLWREQRWSQVLMILAGSLAFLALLGYLYGVEGLYRILPYSSMALHTAAGFLTLAVGIYLLAPSSSLVDIIENSSAGSLLIRRLLPITIVLILLLGWLKLQGQGIGLYGNEFGTALTTLFNILLFVALVGWIAHDLHHIDQQRQQAVIALQQANNDLERRVRDRTIELTQAYYTLQTSEARFAGVVDTAHDAIISVDEQQLILLFNQGAERVFGYSSAETIGHSLNLLLPDRFQGAHAQHIVEFGQSSQKTRIMALDRSEVMGRRKNGEEFPAEVSISWMVLNGRKFFTAVVRDVTAQKRAQDALKSSEQRFRLLVDNVRDYAIFMLDAEGRVVSWNSGAERLSGYLEREIIRKHFSHFYAPESIDAGEPQRLLQLAAQQGYAATEGWHVRKDGSQFWARVDITALRDAQGRLIGFSNITRDLTEQKRADESLKESELRFRRAIIDAPFPIMIHAEDGEVLHISNIWTELSGYTHADIPTIADWTERAYGERRQSVKTLIDSVYNRNSPLKGGEFQVRTKWGEVRIWDFIAAPLGLLPDGRRMVSSMAMDITERKKMEALLRESENRFRTMAELLPAPVLVSRASGGVFTYANPAFGELVGIAPENLIGRTTLDLDMYDNPGERLKLLGKLRIDGVLRNHELYGKRPTDGSRFWVYVSAQFITFDNEPSIVSVFVDITERKRLEQALRESEALLRHVQEILPVGLWIIDSNGNIATSNPTGRQIWAGVKYVGIDQFTEYKGWWLDSGNRIAPEEWAASRAVTKGETSINEEIEIESFDGTHKYILNSAIPILSEQQSIIGAIVVNQDITSLKQTEVKLRQSADELERRNRELQTFVYTASHDLQEPLRKIQAFGDRVQATNAINLTEQGQDYLNRMINAAKRMQALIQDLLAYSRVSTQAEPFRAVDLNIVVKAVCSDLEIAIETAEADIKVDSLATIEADPTQMHQLFQNLLSNALKFRDPKRASVIRISGRLLAPPTDSAIFDSSVTGSMYEMTVADNGIGFEEKYAQQIFGMFQRLHSRTAYEGTGIGLAICQRIIDRHHGTILARGLLGQGTSFIITLPVRQDEED
ncbi:MAG: PAS domain S-box protein [Anaerolineae bacterium]|nr:PAS domain S-box protein [Anaerolineae bacterium]